MKKIISMAMFILLLALPLSSCSNKEDSTQPKENKATAAQPKPVDKVPVQTAKPSETKEKNPADQENTPAETPPATEPEKPNAPVAPPAKEDAILVVAQPHSIPVLINKQNKLPDSYTPSDLVYTTIPFVFQEKNDKRKLRSEAASAIAKLFAEANQQGITLLGVSGYRSHATQVSLFNYYVNKDGYEKARTYSALPGTSEHESGLAIDVTGGNGKCPAQDCFASTPEAKWLQNNVAKYGFIIRYPNGKDSITGYKYEPWHLRYVGSAIATEIMSKGITLEEYYHAIPVNN